MKLIAITYKNIARAHKKTKWMHIKYLIIIVAKTITLMKTTSEILQYYFLDDLYESSSKRYLNVSKTLNLFGQISFLKTKFIEMIGHKITKCMIFRLVHTNISRYTKYKENKNIEIFEIFAIA